MVGSGGLGGGGGLGGIDGSDLGGSGIQLVVGASCGGVWGLWVIRWGFLGVNSIDRLPKLWLLHYNIVKTRPSYVNCGNINAIAIGDHSCVISTKVPSSRIYDSFHFFFWNTKSLMFKINTVWNIKF